MYNKQNIITFLIICSLTLLIGSCTSKDDFLSATLFEVEMTTSKDLVPTNKVSGQITDIDGNIYLTVTIGDQEWMAENLRTSKYRNGSEIPEVKNTESWIELTTGAWVFNNNKSFYNPVYGKLYNWYAVNNNYGLCPNGWHIPNNQDWIELINYLENNAGGKLKVKGDQFWNLPNTGATNESGFTALPGGLRSSVESAGSGHWFEVGHSGVWWSSTVDSTRDDWAAIVEVVFNDDKVSMNRFFQKRSGVSVRCIKD